MLLLNSLLADWSSWSLWIRWSCQEPKQAWTASEHHLKVKQNEPIIIPKTQNHRCLRTSPPFRQLLHVFLAHFCNLVTQRGLCVLHPYSAHSYSIFAPWHFVVRARKHWNLHPIVSCDYGYLKVTARVRRRENLHKRARPGASWLLDRNETAFSVKISIMSSEGALHQGA